MQKAGSTDCMPSPKQEMHVQAFLKCSFHSVSSPGLHVPSPRQDWLRPPGKPPAQPAQLLGCGLLSAVCIWEDLTCRSLEAAAWLSWLLPSCACRACTSCTLACTSTIIIVLHFCQRCASGLCVTLQILIEYPSDATLTFLRWLSAVLHHILPLEDDLTERFVPDHA